jgi:hypothetical protein
MPLDLSAPPKETKYNFLSLGAGVQSSALALMAAHGEITPMPDGAIFADTKAEPASVYRWLDWLENQLPFPVHRVDNGSLTEESLRIRTSKKTGKNYISHAIPAFIKGGGRDGTWFRQCTERHKLSPLNRIIAKLSPGGDATVWIGISWDELQRMRESTRRGVQHRWPLIERRMTRFHCIEWMSENRYPTPPRSSCIYCPYHSNREWRRLRDEEPEAWQEAISYEKRLQAAAAHSPRLDGVPYLHPQRVPLEQVDLRDPDDRQLQLWGSIQNECTGMCGV